MKRMLRFTSWGIVFLMFCNPLFACVEVLQEGFLAGTLVKTVNGYKAIEHVRPSDFICADTMTSVSAEQLVTCTSKKVIAEYIKIVAGNDVIYAALDQKFYLPQPNAWVAARDIQQGDAFLTAHNVRCQVNEIERIGRSAESYALTVPDHVFYIGPTDIRVHNMDIAVTPIIVGKFVLIDIVAAGFMSAVAGLIGKKVVEAIADQSHGAASGLSTEAAAIVQERQMYEQAKSNLLKVRKDLLKIKSGLEGAESLYKNDSQTLTHALLYKMPAIKDVPAINQPSLVVEQQMNESQLAELKQARALELQLLEQQVSDLQISLIFHLNELIDARDAIYQELMEFEDQYNHTANNWNTNVQNRSLAFVTNIYENIDLKQEELIRNLDSAIKELEIAIEFYKDPKNAKLFHEISNIVGIIAEQIEINAGMREDIGEWTKIHVKNIKNVEATLASYNVNVANLRSKASGKIKSAQKARRAQQIAQAEQRRSSIQPPKGPDKENDKEKHPNGKYSGASYHNKHSSKYGKSPAPKNGQKALDNSVQIKNTSPNRVGTSENEIVVLSRTLNGLYHGHVRTWAEINSSPAMIEIRNVLIRSGLVDKFGNIL